MKKITISDVAKASGYTKSSVSCALNGKKGVGENARKKIMKIADELGYTPNAYAQSISLGSSNTIGVILRDISNPFYANVFCAINEVAEEKNYQTLFYSLFDNPDRVQKGINLFKGKMLSGLIIDYFEQDQEMIKKIYELGIPTVIFGQFVDADICCVEADDVNGVDQAIDYIIKNGFKNVYYITHKSYDVYNDRRKKQLKIECTITMKNLVMKRT